jgi:nitrous oxidase accessory protein NosD
MCVLALISVSIASAVAAEGEFVTDPNSPELQAYAAPMDLDESLYGCGPLEQPGATYCVALDGDDEADGTSWDTAWRHVNVAVTRLEAGDTLIIGEGEYVEPTIAMNVETEQSGEPGRPITIMAAPRNRVIITGGAHPEMTKTPGTQFCYQAAMQIPKGQAAVWESDTQILLQRTGSLQMCDELPGTWWYDAESETLHVHFADSRGAQVHGISVYPGRGSTSNFRIRDDRGLDIRASYVCLRGLHFRNYNTGLLISGNPEGEGDARTYRGGDHVTIERCSVSSTTFAGLVLWAGARWNLLRDNYGCLNGARGSMLVNHKDAHDNLFIRNRFDSSAPSIRAGGWRYHFGISTYGHVGRRNHIVGNIMNDAQSFRSKYMFQQTVLEGNVMVGAASTVTCTYPDQQPKDVFEGPDDRIIFRGNVLLKGFATASQPQPESGTGGNWLDDYKCFVNNFVPGEMTVEDARFADPAWVDYRLQADSPLIGAGLGGHDIGDYGQPAGRIFYVAPDGDDANPGTSERRPFATLAKATADLQPGDTLYVMGSRWDEPLVVARDGTEDAPITIRAHNRKLFMLPAIHISGAGVVVEGFAVYTALGEQPDGITVTGDMVIIRKCAVLDHDGAGIRATGGAGLSIEHCTILGNTIGITLEQGSVAATVRDCVVADNRDGAVVISDDSAAGFLASNNCYWGEGLDADRIAGEMGSVIADPDAAMGPGWDSPAAHLAMHGRTAGAEPTLPREPEITDIEVATLSDDAAVITWRTPLDDTTGTVLYRTKGATDWQRQERRTLGTVHGAGLLGLTPGTEYAFVVEAKGRRGGWSQSELLTFTTADQPHEPATYHVAVDGDDSADGLTVQTAWGTIRRACAAVLPGDTVLIGEGSYHHAIAPLCSGAEGRRITFRRAGEGRAIIDGLNVVAPLVDLPARHYITVEGLIFDNLPPAGHPGVVNASNSRGLQLLDCRIGYSHAHGGFGNGVYLYRCPGALIEGNVIWGTRYHVVLNQCPDALVRNNTVSWGQVFAFQVIGNHEGVRFANNILYYPTSVPNAALAIAWLDREITLTSDYNCWGPMVDKTRVAYVYHTSVNDVGPTGLTIADWQADSGLDENSIQADPMFADPKAGDFTLTEGSPCLGAGEGGVNMGALDPLMLTRE